MYHVLKLIDSSRSSLAIIINSRLLQTCIFSLYHFALISMIRVCCQALRSSNFEGEGGGRKKGEHS